jgi:hypothetical protein
MIGPVHAVMGDDFRQRKGGREGQDGSPILGRVLRIQLRTMPV